MTRTLGRVITHLVIDQLVVTLTALWALHAATTHNYIALVIEATLCMYWLRVTWKDLDRWTGPPPERKRVK